MQNMISVNRGPKSYSVLFDINNESQDFENIRVQAHGEPPLALKPHDIEALKDIIAAEVIVAVASAAALYKEGNPVLN